MNLTHEQIVRVFALYLGSDIEIDRTEWNSTKVVGKLVGIESKANKIFYSCQYNGTEQVYHSSHIVKLRLKTLSAITDEDAIEVAKLLGLDYKIEENNIHWVKEFLASLFRRISNFSPFGAFGAFQYLIHQGYAVPLFIEPSHPDNGKTAIELNLAIDITRKTQTHE